MENYIDIEDIRVNYKVLGEGKPIILLHGWGCNLHIFRGLQNSLSTYFRVYVLDFPGFGKSSEPPTVWGTENYARMLHFFCTKLQIKKPILVGHSFGGRIAVYAGKIFPIEKMILVGSAGIKPNRGLWYYMKVYTFKTLKLICRLSIFQPCREKLLDFFSKKWSSKDYRNANDLMRKILIRIVNEDLKKYMSQLKIPVLLIWGENDITTPLKNAKMIHKLIPNSGLAVLKGAGHYVFLEKEFQFFSYPGKFLRKR